MCALCRSNGHRENIKLGGASMWENYLPNAAIVFAELGKDCPPEMAR